MPKTSKTAPATISSSALWSAIPPAGGVIALARDMAHMTQVELAKAYGVGQNRTSAIEKSENLTWETMQGVLCHCVSQDCPSGYELGLCVRGGARVTSKRLLTDASIGHAGTAITVARERAGLSTEELGAAVAVDPHRVMGAHRVIAIEKSSNLNWTTMQAVLRVCASNARPQGFEMALCVAGGPRVKTPTYAQALLTGASKRDRRRRPATPKKTPRKQETQMTKLTKLTKANPKSPKAGTA